MLTSFPHFPSTSNQMNRKLEIETKNNSPKSDCEFKWKIVYLKLGMEWDYCFHQWDPLKLKLYYYFLFRFCCCLCRYSLINDSVFHFSFGPMSSTQSNFNLRSFFEHLFFNTLSRHAFAPKLLVYH